MYLFYLYVLGVQNKYIYIFSNNTNSLVEIQ